MGWFGTGQTYRYFADAARLGPTTVDSSALEIMEK
jgi:hypothetical protein